ncbi:hypothetical protein KO529_10475 [Arenibacter algicola]|uniref:hypothetical protein n=1 Tax=Arenibacter algicola TaxID=616991 RepID=UPI001C074FB1|nr:hypothetical protein [Arenibacter algicola]MBU2905210.1 hypothetical protein [Arenibacter algicola]
MITENKNQDKKSVLKGLNNEVQQNRGLDLETNPNGDSNKGVGKPVDNGGVASSIFDKHLEKQWLAVRDNYLANFPELNDMDTTYDNKSFSTLIQKLAKRRQQTSEQVREEIMNWPSSL